jgi:hypothetical protein
LPPLTPFTDHVTVWLDAPATVAVNACVAPTRRFAEAGLTVTVGVTGGGVVFIGAPVPAQPNWIPRSRKSRKKVARRTSLSVQAKL